MRLQAKNDLERSLTSEMETLRDSLKNEEWKTERMKEELEERLMKRDEEWKVRLNELEVEVEQATDREKRLKEGIHVLEEQIKENSSGVNQSIAGTKGNGRTEVK